MKKLPKSLLLAALGLSLAGAPDAFAQKEPSGDNIWTLQEAVAYASANNLQVRRNLLSKGLAQTDLNQARFGRLPSINGGSSYNFNYGTYVDPTTSELRSEQSRTNNFQLSASVPLFMGFQQVNAIKQNELELQAVEQEVQSAQNDITIQIVTAYLNILFADELIKISQQTRDLTQQQLKRTTILFDAGSVAENAVLDLESQLAADDLELINAENQRDISRLGLMQLLNIPTSQEFQIEVPEIPEPDENPVVLTGEEVYGVAVETLPAIKAADLRVLSAEKALDVARGGYYPRLSMFGGLNTFYSSARDFRFPEQGALQATPIGFTDSEGKNPFIVYTPTTTFRRETYGYIDQLKDGVGKNFGFSLQVPILNGLQVRSNVQRAKLQQQDAQITADIARNNLRQTIEQAYVDAIAAQRRYVAAKEQLRAAEKNYGNARLRLDAGVINTVDFNIIANSYRAAQSNLLQAKYEYTFKQKVLDFYQGEDISF
ncbi:TolC family protein [Pontibacter akesuensis]|uniref:Outer membrane protein n=1 Tax=Pontibacter akesuensis TaxID=388950 RepID=A0A1I7G3Q0_9BACT|nr:TolC family protein [Pontibacter akesuensis]GHA59054.1 transporter [Pontibacter akesuensis]SFU42961.1 outer membrane protein [Pontibacter akesuensis]